MPHASCQTTSQSTASYESIKGRKHTWRGSRSVAQLRRAATLRLEITSEKASVKLQSKTGHILPGGTLRTIILEVKLLSLRKALNGKQSKSQFRIKSKTVFSQVRRELTFSTLYPVRLGTQSQSN